MRPIVPLPLLRGAAAIVLAASFVAGGRALYRDLTIAFRDAGPSNIPSSVRRQIETVEAKVPPGARILLVSPEATDELWYTRLFQRAFYPRNAVIIRYLPLARPAADALRRRWTIGYGIAFRSEAIDLGFLGAEDLGTLPGSSDRVWAGEMAPP